jgi:hypothetical protein
MTRHVRDDPRSSSGHAFRTVSIAASGTALGGAAGAALIVSIASTGNAHGLIAGWNVAALVSAGLATLGVATVASCRTWRRPALSPTATAAAAGSTARNANAMDTGINLGVIGPSPTPGRMADFRIPQRGVFAIGRAFFR